MLKDAFEIDNQYKFITNEDILDSFKKVFQDYNVVYKSYKISKNIYVRYLLEKLKENENVSESLFNHFNNSLTNLKFKNKKIPVDYTNDGKMFFKDKITKQTGQSINNNIKIKDLNKGILRVRYSNNRKLSNKLLKDDYKISKRMVNAIKFNEDIHKLSSNEKNMYYELQTFLNKEQDINVFLIGNYLSGNHSKSLYNKINKILYNKLKK